MAAGMDCGSVGFGCSALRIMAIGKTLTAGTWPASARNDRPLGREGFLNTTDPAKSLEVSQTTILLINGTHGGSVLFRCCTTWVAASRAGIGANVVPDPV